MCEIIIFIHEMGVIESGGNKKDEFLHQQDGVEQIHNDLVLQVIIYLNIQTGTEYIMLDDGLEC
jgi:hypothetical protein